VLDEVSLHVEAGEIVGVAGLVGSGRTTLLRALAGLERGSMARLAIGGQARGLPRSPREARALGISLLPEDRKAQGLVLDLPAAENVLLGSHPAFGTTSPSRMRRDAREPAGRNGFDTRRLDEPARNFSGGNQQKLLLARAMSARVSVMLADEPTRGIDIHAKGEIYRSLSEAAGRGLAVIVVSSELEELITVCARIYVLARRRNVAEIHRGTKEWTVGHILEHAFEAEARRPAANQPTERAS
jgi:ABC-type sugar transport system ATPase subunit